ncbi:BMP family ABC transporter substrate-binding protein [bacterium]|jgi:basic membrane protein A|nr:BMP family ABC transporter substrate-binding protein [bacterium]
MKFTKFFAFSIAFALSSTNARGADEFKVGLVLDRGGRDDKSFNAAAFRGANQAQMQLHLNLKTVEAADDNAYETLLRSMAQKDFDLIIGVGVAQQEAIKKVSAQFPKKHFVIVDAEVKAPNVKSLMFKEHEGSYLVGAIAAMSSKSGKIGFVGGMSIPLIKRFELGYEAGAKSVNPNIAVLKNYVGMTSEAWNNPPKAKEIAMQQYQGGADVIFAAAGASSSGVFDAAEDKKKYAIGVDSNQNWIKPGLILTSMMKRLDVAIFQACQSALTGSFKGGTENFGLSNNGIDYALDEFNEKLISPDMKKKIESIKEAIIAGKIKVPDYYKQKG